MTMTLMNVGRGLSAARWETIHSRSSEPGPKDQAVGTTAGRQPWDRNWALFGFESDGGSSRTRGLEPATDAVRVGSMLIPELRFQVALLGLDGEAADR